VSVSLSHQSSRESGALKPGPLSIADVSRPCQPRWITRVDAADANFRAAFADYLPQPISATSTGITAPSDTEFRPRLPTN